jgi:hypothetical protein
LLRFPRTFNQIQATNALSINILHSAQEILGFKHKEFLSKARLIDDHFLTNGATQ